MSLLAQVMVYYQWICWCHCHCVIAMAIIIVVVISRGGLEPLVVSRDNVLVSRTRFHKSRRLDNRNNYYYYYCHHHCHIVGETCVWISFEIMYLQRKRQIRQLGFCVIKINLKWQPMLLLLLEVLHHPMPWAVGHIKNRNVSLRHSVLVWLLVYCYWPRVVLPPSIGCCHGCCCCCTCVPVPHKSKCLMFSS